MSGELTNTQEQPETPATQSEKAASAVISPNEYAGTSSDENPAPISHPQPAASLGADKAGAVSSSTAPATLSEKKDCLKLKDGHCKISFDTPALCSVCNAERMKARAA